MLFQPADMTAIYNERLAIIFGLITLTSGLAAFFSCRTCVNWLIRIGMKNPLNNKGYSAFYKYHIYYWWSFGVLLVAHILVAVIHTGLPQAGDSDANIHWMILGFGLFSAITAVFLFSSCRIVPRLISRVKPGNPLKNLRYRSFFGFHSYFWGVLALLVVLHFVIAYNHAGVWPGG
jgi:hypothetical protein